MSIPVSSILSAAAAVTVTGAMLSSALWAEPLKTARLVRVHADRQRRIYELNPDGVDELAQWVARIRAFWNPKLDALEAALKRDPS